MEIETAELGNGVTKVTLAGRMDIEGSHKVDLKFQAAAAANRRVVVDMSGVSFLASLGMRTLVMGAKATAGKGGRMVIVAPQAGVEKVLRSSAVDSVIPIAADLPAALTLVGA